MKTFKKYAILALLSISMVAPLYMHAMKNNTTDSNIVTSTSTAWYKKPIIKYSIMTAIGLIIVYASFHHYDDMTLVKLMERKKSKKTPQKQSHSNMVNSTIGSNSISNCIVTGTVTQDGIVTKTNGEIIPQKNNARVISTKIDALGIHIHYSDGNEVFLPKK